MKTQILIVSHFKDKPYLEWNLKSIRKFATGFSGTTLVVPALEAMGFLQLAHDFELSLKCHNLPGHLGAQTQKCLADIHCPEADFILHTDSDCVFTEPVTPEDYFVGGKPVMLIERFDRLPGNPWKAETERALRIPVEFETMRRHPQVNPFGIYAEMRSHVEAMNGLGFESYVMNQKPDYPWGFSEHCTIGAFALSRAKWRSAYHWIDTGTQPHPHSKLAQFWSLSPPDQPQDLPSGGHGLPMETFKRLGL